MGSPGIEPLRRALRRPPRPGLVAVACALLLGSCGGGGGGGGDSPVVPPVPPAGLVSLATPFAAGCGGPAAGGTLYANAEVEPYLAVNPANAGNLIGTWQQDRWSNGGSQGNAVAYSMDGGTTWSQRALPVTRCGGGNAANGGDYDRASDPWVTISPDGTAYQASLVLSGGLLLPGSRSAIVVSRSADGGRNWGPTTAVIADGDQFFNDKDSITADPTDSRYVYAVWDRLTMDNRGPAMFARTVNGGASWEAARAIYDPGVNNQTLGNVIVVLPDGTLVDFFIQLNAVNQGFFAVVRSADKGASWSAPVRIADYMGVGTRDPDTGAAIRDSGFLGQIAVGPQGQLYAVWQDARFSSGARDAIAFSRSDDGGLNWSAPVRVNAAPAVQALIPTVNARADGTIGVSYFDMRSNLADPATLPVDYWLARSRDGVSWNESRIVDAFDLALAPVAGGYFIGDYQALASAGSTFYPFYARTNSQAPANRTDVFVTPVNVPLGGTAEAGAVSRFAERAAPAAMTPEYRQKVRQAIVRKLDERLPGWAARVQAAAVPAP